MKREKLDSLSERDLLIGMITSDNFCREIAPIINPRQLEVEYARIVASWIKEYYSMYLKAPKHDIAKLYRAHCEELRDEALQDNVLSFIEKLSNDYERLSNFNDEFALEQAVEYLKGRALKNLSQDVDAFLLSGDVSKAENAITKFKRVERSNGESASILYNTEEIINTFTDEDSTLFKFPGAYGQVTGKFNREDFFAFVAPMKRGKCLGYGTEVLMADGSIKEVQDIKKFDKLMGPDSQPRNVLSISRGRGPLYKVVARKGNRTSRPTVTSFVCNGDHILCLVNKWGGYKEISVEDYLKLPEKNRKIWRLFKVGVNYTNKYNPIPVDIVASQMYRLSNMFPYKDIRIPQEYLTTAKTERIALLEEIKKCCKTTRFRRVNGYIMEFNNPYFAKSVLQLCQQLGLSSYGYMKFSECSVLHYYVAYEEKRECIRSSYNYFPFKIEPMGEGDYYGFVLDKDHRFLLGDCTVSHNTFHLIYTAETAMMNGLKVIFFSLEMSRANMIKRMWMSLSGQLNENKEDIDFPYFEEGEDGKYRIKHKTISRKAVSIIDIEKKQKSLRRLSRGGDIQIVAVPAYSLTVEALDNYLDDFEQKGYIPDVIIVDYADIMAPSEKGDYRNQLDGIWKRLRGLAQKRKALVVTASQSGRASIDRDVDATDIAEDIRKIAHVTSMVSLNQTPTDIKNGVMKLKQLAIREGEREFRQAVCLQCLSIGKPVLDSHFDDEVVIDYEEVKDEDDEKVSRRRR